MNANALRWSGAAGIVALAVLRCCVVFTSEVVFDADPAFDAAPPSALGKAGSLILDIALIVSCILALAGEWRSRRGLDPLLLLLALLPLPIIIWHGSTSGANMWRGCTWLAAAVACATIAHLARDRTLRIAMFASLVAVVAPLLIRGAAQMTWEHAATVDAYDQTREQFLAARGWEPDSPATRIYERRLMHREPTGWFPSTNIYGSIMGAAAVMLAGLALTAFHAYRRQHLQSGAWFLCAAITIACLIALWLTTSTGALLATMAGFVMLALLIALDVRASRTHLSAAQYRAHESSPRASPPPDPALRIVPLALAVMIVGAIIGVIVRGAVLPESFLDEKSLLFRWHYLQAAFGMFMQVPLRGVGPSGFQMAYMAHRVPRNPEEVQSAHAMFTDWIATLGVLGTAWVALIAVLIARSGTLTTIDRSDARPHSPIPTLTLRFASIVAALALLPAMVIEWPALTEPDILLRAIAAGAFIALAAVIASILAASGSILACGIALAGAAVLLVHGQIEMTFHHGGSVVWLMAVVGLIGRAKAARSQRANTITAALALLTLGAFAAWILLLGARPALAQERAMRDAAAMLAPLRDNPDDLGLALERRRAVAEHLVAAYALWPTNHQPLNAAMEQLLIAAEQPPRQHDTMHTGAPLGLLMRGEEIAEYTLSRHVSASSTVLAINIHAALAALTGEQTHWTRAIDLARWMTTVDPHGSAQWRRLGDVLWAAGMRREAADAYQTALNNNDNFALDPLKQFSDAVRASLTARIAEARRDDNNSLDNQRTP